MLKNTLSAIAICSLVIGIASCNTETKLEETKTIATQNVLLEEWTGPYGGVPAFDKMEVGLIKDAMVTAMATNITEIEAIANSIEPATFENTILAFEAAGQELNRVETYYSIYKGSLSSDEFREVSKEIEPMKSEHTSAKMQNVKLFQRIKTVYDASQKTALPADQQWVTRKVYDRFSMNGADLDDEKKKRYAAINKELAVLQSNFSENVLHDEEGYITYITKEQLSGLPESLVKNAASAASTNGKEGAFAITNQRSSMDPFLTYSDERELRKTVWNNYYSRGDNGDEYDNNAIIVNILKLRNERVKLLGFDNFAQWRLQNRMAKNPENALDLLDEVWPYAIGRVKEEVADMQALSDELGNNITIEPWDYRYYAEKVRKKKYDLDGDEVKNYLQLDKLREAMFFVAGELFNFEFTSVAEGSVPVFHEDVKVWEVTDKDSKSHIGLWYLDPYARKGKRSGAWATTYRDHTNLAGEKTVLCSNNSNFIKGAPGEPVLVSWDDATTFFHEMGHALHFLSGNNTYPTQNSGVRDFTEFQSQLLERWLSTDEVNNTYLLHYKTGEPMPAELITKIKNAATFNQGFSTTEYMASAIMDMKFHMMDPTNLDVDTYERETLKEMGMPSELVMRHRSPQFNHVFSSEGYATGYYGYMWADVLTADAAEAFAEAEGGYYDKAVAKKLVETLFTPRGAVDPAEAYRAFRGRDAVVDALMRGRGFSKM